MREPAFIRINTSDIPEDEDLLPLLELPEETCLRKGVIKLISSYQYYHDNRRFNDEIVEYYAFNRRGKDRWESTYAGPFLTASHAIYWQELHKRNKSRN